MSEPAAPPLRTWRPMAAWTAGILLALGLAWFVGAVVVPVWRTREIVLGCEERYGDAWDKTCPDAVALLGGSERAARHLAIYVRIPDRLAPGKYEAFGILASCGRPAAPVLAENLRRSEKDRRTWAAKALCRLGADSEKAVPELTRALDDPELRGMAAEALSMTESGHMAAVPVFVDRLSDREAGHYASMTLARMARENPSIAQRLLEEFHSPAPHVRAGVSTAFGAAGGDCGLAAVPAMVRALDDPESMVRSAAAEGLARLGPAASAAVPRLAKALMEDKHDWTRRNCAAALGLVGDLRGRDALASALKDPFNDVRGAAVEAIARLGGPQAPATLMPALKDASPSVRLAAVRSLGSLKARTSARAIVGMLRDENHEISSSAVYALGQIGDPDTAEALAEVAKSEKSTMRSLAATALGEIESPRVVEPLIGLLSDPDSATRHYAARSLGKTKDPRAIAPLIGVIRSVDGTGRYEASMALGQIGDSAVDPLLVALKDDAPEVRVAAARALGMTGSRRAIAPLEAALNDRQGWSIREVATEALKKIRGEESKP